MDRPPELIEGSQIMTNLEAWVDQFGMIAMVWALHTIAICKAEASCAMEDKEQAKLWTADAQSLGVVVAVMEGRRDYVDEEPKISDHD